MVQLDDATVVVMTLMEHTMVATCHLRATRLPMDQQQSTKYTTKRIEIKHQPVALVRDIVARSTVAIVQVLDRMRIVAHRRQL
jgi:hypothetical protein